MRRPFARSVLVALALIAGSASARAQTPAEGRRYPWAEKMFSALEHDFGVVARGSEARFRIEITNLYDQELHFQQITTSCGCTAVKSLPTMSVRAPSSFFFLSSTCAPVEAARVRADMS